MVKLAMMKKYREVYVRDAWIKSPIVDTQLQSWINVSIGYIV